MIESKLSKLQSEFLDEFFRRDSRFFLTGGAALAGFYLGHRETYDLDLFTLENEIESGARLVAEVATSTGATVEPIQTSPDFRRFLVSRTDESIVVDLVREYVFQIETDKRVINGIRIDTPDEILANKLCALLSRSEIRDLVDVRQLEIAGNELDTALEFASKKDSGFSPAQLAWILSQITIGDDAVLPDRTVAADLRMYLNDLVKRLSIRGFPGEN